MSIQSNINQGLGVAGFLLSQTPAAEKQKKRDEEKALSKEWNTIQDREKIMQKQLAPENRDKLKDDEYNALKDYYTGQFTNQFFSVGERLGALRSQLGYEVPEKGLDRALRKYRELQDLEKEPLIADIQRERVETIKKNKKQEKEINKGFMGARLDPEMDVKGGETWRK